MKKFLLALVAVGSVACGDLSQEDLLFYSAIPTKDAVRVAPPGAEREGRRPNALSQGLCAEGDLRCTVAGLASGFNGATFSLLDLIDTITSFPPTERAVGRRVWGPIFDESKNRSFRFEMRREDLGFSFCLHAAEGRIAEEKNGKTSCEDGGPMTLILAGFYDPANIDGSARLGSGTMQLATSEIARLDERPADSDSLNFEFDNTSNTYIRISASGRVDSTYEFFQDRDGAGQLVFDFPLEAVQESGQESLLEHGLLSASWTSEQSGRAHVDVDGGNVPDGSQLSIDQCWDSVTDGLETLYYKGADGAETGNVGACDLSLDLRGL